MADRSPFRTLIETPEYTGQLTYLAVKYSPELIEGTLMGLQWGIATNPEGYERVTGNISEAKGRSFNTGIPSLRIFFQIKDADNVLLLWVEEISSIEEMWPES